MSMMENSFGCCLICYKPIPKHGETVETQDGFNKFIKNVNQFCGSRVTNTICDVSIVNWCKKCENIITGFIKGFHEFKLLELQLEYLLEKLVEKINYANKVPARWKHVKTVLEEMFPNDLDEKAENQNRIRKFRQDVIKAGFQRKLQSQPRVLLQRDVNIDELRKPTTSTSKPVKDLEKHQNTEKRSSGSDIRISNKNTVCPKCGKRLKSIVGLQIHLEHHKDQSQWKWQCNFCNKRFSTKQNLKVHYRSHTGVKPFKCRFCEEDFRYRSEFTKHLKTSHENGNGVEEELRRKWAFKFDSDPILIESTDKTVEDQSNYQTECDDDMADEWVDYGGDHNDILVDPDEDIFSESHFELEPDCSENITTSNIETEDTTAIFKDPQIQIKLEHLPAIGQVVETDDVVLPVEDNSLLAISLEQTIQDPPQPLQEVARALTLNQCSKCGKKLKTAYGLQIHLEYHKDPKDWKWGCKSCGKNCATGQNLETHMKTHKNKNNFKCHYCGEIYRNGVALKSHLLDKHANGKGMEKEFIKTKSIEIKTTDSSSNQIKIVRNEAEVNSDVEHQQNRYSLRVKRVTKFVNEFDSDDDDTAKNKIPSSQTTRKRETSSTSSHASKSSALECEVCTRKFKSFLKKEFHFKKCHDQTGKSDKEILRCKRDKCTAYFLEQTQLSDHYKKEHSGGNGIQKVKKKNIKSLKQPAPFECEICNGKYQSLRKKEEHFEKSHDLSKLGKNGKVEKCGVDGCTAYFLDGTKLNLHRWFQHHRKTEEGVKKMGSKNFECEKCGKIFTLKNSYTVHLLYHHGESGWKWKCEICGKKSPTRYKMNEHVRTHTRETPYQCQFCGERFSMVNKFSVHLKKEHGKEISEGEAGKFGVGKKKVGLSKKKNLGRYKLGEVVKEIEKEIDGRKRDLKGKGDESREAEDVFEGDDASVISEKGEDDDEKEIEEEDFGESFGKKTVETKVASGKETGSIVVTQDEAVEKLSDENQLNRYSLRENRVKKFVDEIDKDDDDDPKDIEYNSAESSSNTAVSTDDDENLTKQREKTESLKQRTRKLYNCSKCGKKLKTKFGLQVHLEYHKDPKTCKWECKICGKNCGTKCNLQAHMRKHNRSKPLKCRFCVETFSLTTALKSHMRDKHGNGKELREKSFSSCKSCGKMFRTLRALKIHMNSKCCIKREFEEDVNCGECDEVFHSNVAMWTHKKEIHKIRICVECGKQFETNSSLNLHLECHKDPKEWKFECTICGRRCLTKLNLDKHVIGKHTQKKRNRELEEIISTEDVSGTSSRSLVECQVCKRKFTSFLNKELHYKKCHDLSGTNGEKEVEKCEVAGCTAYFMDKSQLKLHSNLEHKEGSRLESEETWVNWTKRFVCGKCGKSLAHKTSLQRHLEYHKDPSEWKWECGTCGRKSMTEFKLKEHMRTHTKEISKECQVCGKMFETANSLSNHIKKFHGNVNQIEVEMDGKDSSAEVVGKGKSLYNVGILSNKEQDSIDERLRVRNSESSKTANFLTKKGDCFGDGTLVELEDLD